MALSPALSRYAAVLLDLDGRVWVGDEPCDGAAAAVDALREAGMAVRFLTNDVRHSPEEVVRKLWRLGFRANVGEVVSVGAALQRRLAERDGGTAFVIGARALVDHVAAAGLRIVNRTPFASRADVVVVAEHEELDYGELRTRDAGRAARRRADRRDPRRHLPDARRPVAGVRRGPRRRRGGDRARAPTSSSASRSRRCTSRRSTACRRRCSRSATASRSTSPAPARAGLDAALVLTGGALRPTGDDALRVADSLGALVLG